MGRITPQAPGRHQPPSELERYMAERKQFEKELAAMVRCDTKVCIFLLVCAVAALVVYLYV